MRYFTLKHLFMALVAVLLLQAVPAAAAVLAQDQHDDNTRLLRFPATNGEQIVFTFAGNLFTVGIEGGVARQLTNHEGFEMFPRFSPDGTEIAFTGQYDGNTEVYLMPAEGGIPQRLTITATLGRDDVGDRMGPNNIVMGWHPTLDAVLYRSRKRSFNAFQGQLFLAGRGGDISQQVPLPRGGFASYSPDGTQLAYNRIFREFRTWKRYRGGMADDIWIHDFESRETINFTNSNSQDIIPMWHGDQIFFASDRDDNMRMNLWVQDVNGTEARQLTFFEDFDIKFPSIGGGFIVFENGGFIYRFHIESEQLDRVPIRVHSDNLFSRGGLVQVHDQIQFWGVAPDGSRALFGARGDIFTVPASSGITRNITQSAGVHDRNPAWSPDGRHIAYISDKTGENEIWMRPQDGSGEAVQLTDGADTYFFSIQWSPDSRYILWTDKKLRLRFVDTQNRRVTTVDTAEFWEISSFTWSPDSKWIAWTRPETEGMQRIWMYSVASGESFPVTDKWFSSGNPAFSDCGRFLFFTSNRDFNPIYSWTEWNHAYQDMSRIYMIALAQETRSPFLPQNDEVNAPESSSESAISGDNVKVDRAGIIDRIIQLPVQPSNYFNLNAAGGRIYYMRNGSRDQRALLLMYDIAAQKETELGAVNSYLISADGKKMMVWQQGRYGIIDLPARPVEVTEPLSLSNMRVNLDRQAEWLQIFDESWRQMRDFLYADNLHGVDWHRVRELYRPLAEAARHRLDLTYVIGEMIGELNVGHAYVGGGDVPQPARVPLGLLGAELSRDGSGFYRIDRVLRGQNWVTGRRSPLTEVGASVPEGHYIIAVNGMLTSDMANIFESLIGLAGETVVLTVNERPRTQGAREVLVQPVADEADLYYFNWVQRNIEIVNEATNGRVGYIHIPDMSPAGLNEFVKHFYPQLRREALIIDVRGNGGGNVSPMIIERLRREIAMVSAARNVVQRPNPEHMMLGPMVTLLDEHSASDGDIFPFRFRQHNLGPLIGMRSWGGVIGIRGSLPFTDGGILNRPEYGLYNIEGTEWIIEGVGVEPDIEIDNDPAREFDGIDDQLNRGIGEILRLLETEGFQLPPRPDFPIRN
ncbi:MAG: PD40 domain-containing protein [Balneolales bacterium]|nr:PD40 domain-containing protein [Balneolales bacterium]